MLETIKPIKLNSSEVRIFFTSDTHFGHKNIIKFCDRPWNTTEEMDEGLIENWNSVVDKNDIVFHLGDFAFSSNGKWKGLIERLNGKIHLILGNHDGSRYPGDNIMSNFESVQQQAVLKIDNRKIYLNHFPILCYDGTYKSKDSLVWQLFGHVHTQKDKIIGKDFDRLQHIMPTQYDVGVDFNDYKPISFEEVSEKINYQVDNNVNYLTWIKQ